MYWNYFSFLFLSYLVQPIIFHFEIYSWGYPRYTPYKFGYFPLFSRLVLYTPYYRYARIPLSIYFHRKRQKNCTRNTNNATKISFTSLTVIIFCSRLLIISNNSWYDNCNAVKFYCQIIVFLLNWSPTTIIMSL